MCLIDEVGERNTFKNKKSVSTLGVTDNVCVTVLSYEYKCPTSLYSCEFEKKEWMVKFIESSLDILDSWKNHESSVTNDFFINNYRLCDSRKGDRVKKVPSHSYFENNQISIV